MRAPTVVRVLLAVVPHDRFPVAVTEPADTLPLAVRSVRLLMLLLFMLTAIPRDIPVLLKLVMLWLSALTNLTDWPFKVKVVPELVKAAFAMAIYPLTAIELEVILPATILPVNTHHHLHQYCMRQSMLVQVMSQN